MQPAARIDDIAAEFSRCDPRERLELLLEYAEDLPQLPPRLQVERDKGLHRVQECQTPVYLWVEVEDGRVQVFADVAPEAPTVRGFVGILVKAISGASVADALAVPGDVLNRFGLAQTLGMMRAQGLGAVVRRILGEIRKSAEAGPFV